MYMCINVLCESMYEEIKFKRFFLKSLATVLRTGWWRGGRGRLWSSCSQEEMAAWARAAAVGVERKDGFEKRPTDPMAWTGEGLILGW